MSRIKALLHQAKRESKLVLLEANAYFQTKPQQILQQIAHENINLSHKKLTKQCIISLEPSQKPCHYNIATITKPTKKTN